MVKTACLGVVFVLAVCGRVHGLIYLPEHSLEEELVGATVCIIGEVEKMEGDTATVAVHETPKQPADKTLGDKVTVSGTSVRISRQENRKRFAVGDSVIIFLDPLREKAWPIRHSVVLRSKAEVKTMSGCVAEVGPFAQVLADAADVKKEVKEETLREAVNTLLKSKNAFTQILMGRVLGRTMLKRYKPDAWTAELLLGLQSKRRELRTGAIRWSDTFEKLPEEVRKALTAIAADREDKANAKLAQEVLDGHK